MVLKKIILSFVILLLLCSILSAGKLGLGIIIGEPTGFSLKFWQSRRTAIDLALAWNFGDDYFHIHGDYLYHIPIRLEGRSRSTLLWYLGIGARLKFRSGGRNNNTAFGIRGVGGIEFLPREIPIDLFAEIAPVMNIIEDTKLELEGGVGIRYNFNL
ncbi:hypothetical protein KAU34_04890 [candidate division WOR-3 bacterium]|nr:hypothetical protein [candidate division WOR-3 bacterium]MCK4575720.1 hypothetical protein [candidate division WOR-3 bacterium]